MKKQLFVFFALISVIANSYAQQSVGGTPVSFMLNDASPEIPGVEFPPLDYQLILQEDEEREESGELDLFSRLLESDITLENSGLWEELENGDRIWRMQVTAREAQAINFLYNDFHIGNNSVLYIYSADGTMVLGGFTAANNKDTNLFATGNVMGESVIIELFEPAEDLNQNSISINQIGYVYRNAFAEIQGELRGSDPCQVDIFCSEGNEWADQEKGVIRILLTSSQGQGWCSGSLVNNTSLDCAPLILTAWHCGENSSPAQYGQYIYYFNYQASSCGANNPAGTQSVTGSTRLAYSNDGGGNSGSDFLLTEINGDLPSAVTPYFNGWSAVNTTSGDGVSIHHPAGDYKKISTYTNNLNNSTWGGTPSTHWRVNWTATANGHGVTEGGSSGSPIFNSDGLIMGQLTGGSSFCTSPNSPDFYGKMSYNWTSNGNQNFEQLKNFLDPTNTGLLTLEGSFDPCADPIITGCTDEEAINYDPLAEADDGSCQYPCEGGIVNVDLMLDCYGSETGWSITDLNDNVIIEVAQGTYDGSEGDPLAGGSTVQQQVCVTPGCYIFTITDEFGDGMAGAQWNGCDVNGDLTVTDGLGEELIILLDPDFGSEASAEFCVEELDLDNDGFLVSEGDCDESNADINPGMDEVCDGIDNNCDGNIDEGFTQIEFWMDADNDNFGDANISVMSCFLPDGYASNPDDCDDTNANINPAATEQCDGIDNNCNAETDEGYATAVYYLDSDGDGYGNNNASVISCFQPDNYVTNGDDCNDVNGNINPGASEVCNGADDDCSGTIDDNLTVQIYYEDDDNDGFGNADVSVEDCQQPNGFVLNNLDCDDSDNNINPDGTEILDDGIDQDCNGEDLVTGISEESFDALEFFPNPASSSLIIKNAPIGSVLKLIDARGRTIKELIIQGVSETQVDVSRIDRGTYIMHLMNKDSVKTNRIILQ
ncbi:MAG: MopE-related protein [Flavobacteriales bacterium]